MPPTCPSTTSPVGIEIPGKAGGAQALEEGEAQHRTSTSTSTGRAQEQGLRHPALEHVYSGLPAQTAVAHVRVRSEEWLDSQVTVSCGNSAT